jgi:uncharacterized membrane protein YedE/YeeE
MPNCEEKLGKIKSMHTSNFIFWIFGKFLLGLGVGILLATYYWNPLGYWVIAGWLVVVFAVILQIPAFMAAFYKREGGKEKFKSPPKATE